MPGKSRWIDSNEKPLAGQQVGPQTSFLCVYVRSSVRAYLENRRTKKKKEQQKCSLFSNSVISSTSNVQFV